MKTLSSGIFTVSDGEVVTIDVRSSGTLFGVNHKTPTSKGPLKQGVPLILTMDKSAATGKSTIAGAKSTTLTLTFNFSANKGGKYDWTVTGSEGGDTFDDFVTQAGGTAEAVRYRFHIV